ncbi:hypothetical protein BRC64_11985 [Halobacteriales archaeon QH_10_67_22]|nr:MAG: hypothetical protein BRC64_11985 [Halobacteriales archaeon QH_10_67_22]
MTLHARRSHPDDKNVTEADDEDGPDRDPFGDERIEVPEDEMRKAAAPAVLAGRIKRKLNEVATALTYGR